MTNNFEVCAVWCTCKGGAEWGKERVQGKVRRKNAASFVVSAFDISDRGRRENGEKKTLRSVYSSTCDTQGQQASAEAAHWMWCLTIVRSRVCSVVLLQPSTVQEDD